MFEFTSHRNACILALSTLPVLMTSGCSPAGKQGVSAAGGGHAHAEPVVVTQFTDKVELFMEYPRLEPKHKARFLAHVTVLATGEPVRSGSLRIELSSATGETRVLEAAEPTRDGLFIPVATFDAAEEWEAKLVVTSDQVQETLQLAPMIVHADSASAMAAAKAEAAPDKPDLVPFFFEQQWRIGLLTEEIERRTLIKRLQVAGEIKAPHHAMAVAGAPVAGRLLPPDSGSLPHLGDWVEKGQVIAYIEPPLTTSDRAQLAVNRATRDALEMELLLRELDVQAKALEIEQTLLQTEARIEFRESALARIEGLRAKGLGTQQELEAAQRDMLLARREREGAEALKRSLETTRAQLTQLQERSAALRSEAAPNQSKRHAVIAPISGEIIDADNVEGESIVGSAAVFRLLDLRKVWVVMHVSEFDLGEIKTTPGALLEFAAFPGERFDVLGDLNGRAVHIGKVVDPTNRTVRLHYEAENTTGLFRDGMFADVFLETQRAVSAIAIPEESIVMDGGQPTAFVLVEGETFQKRTLQVGIRDGDFVEVLSGIEAGERVVTQGAYMVKLASASPASFGHGHVH